MAGRYAESDGKHRKIWEVARLWQLAETLEPITIPLEEIVGLDQVTWFSESQRPTTRAIAEHARRIMAADSSYPPILTEDRRVFDGMHRIAKALMTGQQTIVVKQFLVNPAPDQIEEISPSGTDT